MKDLKLRYFKASEFTMNNERVNVFKYMNIDFLFKLDELRHIFGSPMSPSSSYRTESFNIAIGGASKSMHLLGRAVDIPIDNYSGAERVKLMQTALGLGLTVGVRDDIMHIDDRKDQTVFGY